MKYQTKLTTFFLSLLVVGLVSGESLAAKLKPYVLASDQAGDYKTVKNEVKEKLKTAGFQIVGQTSPRADAHVFVITNGGLKSVASKTTNGGFGAVQRVSITKSGDKIQVAYTNPAYWAAAFRMKGNLGNISKKLEDALGKGKPFGSEDGLDKSDLRKYHYAIMMPYFDDVDEIGEASSHEEAIKKVEAGLAAKKGGVKKVYKIKIPGKNEVVYGVKFTKGQGGDKKVLSTTDKETLKHTAYLPYELLITDNKIVALNAKFRIAIAFPDLSMGTFMKIRKAPGDIEDSLEEVVSGK